MLSVFILAIAKIEIVFGCAKMTGETFQSYACHFFCIKLFQLFLHLLLNAQLLVHGVQGIDKQPLAHAVLLGHVVIG